MQTHVSKDATGLRVLWDSVKKCYCFEDADGSLLPFTITMQSGDAATEGFNGPTIEALLAISKHRIETYNQGEFACKENKDAIFHADMALWNLERRFRRVSYERQLDNEERRAPNQAVVAKDSVSEVVVS